jgi:pyruvate kinase
MQGPKMRVGRFATGPIELSPGDRFALTAAEVKGNQEIVSVTYASLASDVEPGDSVALDDGLIRLRVDAVEGNSVHTIVEDGGTLSDNKGLNLPGVSISAPGMTDKDRQDLAFAISGLKADYIALSFVRSAQDVEEAKALTGDVPVIAKIERPEAVAALSEIVAAADGIMIARGDLGVELGAEKVPLIQKRIIRETNAGGKVVITATQMLDSMIRNPRPTRAEAADVANAVMDGTDAVMLSGETAAGRYPVQSLEMMDAIIREVESDYVEDLSREFRELKSVGDEDWPFSNAAARAAAVLTTHLPLKAVVVFTQDGRSAGLLAEHRPRAPILAVTSDVRVARRLALEWGVIPRIEVPPESLDETLRIATSLLVREKLCQRGEAFALVVGWPTSGRTNTLKLHRL